MEEERWGGECSCSCVAISVMARWASFCLCLVLLGAVGVLHLSCVLFALGGLSDGAVSWCSPGEGRREKRVARRCV